jgi:hypothetical protein
MKIMTLFSVVLAAVNRVEGAVASVSPERPRLAAGKSDKGRRSFTLEAQGADGGMRAEGMAPFRAT